MNNAVDGGGGGGSDFDWAAFYEAAYGIEHCLGWLKGNELVIEYLTRLQARAAQGEAVSASFFEWVSPAGEYPIRIDQFSVPIPYTGDGDVFPEDLEPVLAQIHDDLTSTFESGVAWASGIASYLARLAEPMTEVSLDGLGAVVSNMRGIELWGLLPADFAKDVTRGRGGAPRGIPFGETLDNWAGDSSLEFRTFYRTLSDIGARYTVVMNAAAAWVDATGTLIGTTRGTLNEYLAGMHDGLLTHLAQWESANWTPQSFSEAKGELPAPIEFGQDLLTLIPIVDKVIGTPPKVKESAAAIQESVDDASTVLGFLDKWVFSADSTDPHKSVSSYEVQTAEQVYTTITSGITDDFLTPLRDGIDLIAAERSRPTIEAVHDLAADLAWFPYPVPPSIANDDWSFKDPPLA